MTLFGVGVGPVVAKLEVLERAETVVVAGHDGVGGLAVPKGEELFEHFGDAVVFLLYDNVGEQRPALILTGGIADLVHLAPNEHDRPVARPL